MRDGRRDRGLPALFPFVLALAAALVLAGCGGAGGGGSQPSGGGNGGAEARSSGSSEPGDVGGQTAQLGTPSLGREGAPVVLTEYSDYQ